MKTIATTLLVLCFTVISASAQIERPAGFANIPWRTKLDETKRMMLAKPGIQFDPRDSTASRLGFNGGTFAGKPAVIWGLEFVDGGLYRGAVVLKAFGDRSKEYDAAKSILTQKYGQPTSNSKKGKDSKAIWKFPPDLKNKDAEVIVLWNNPSGGVKITYRNESMNAGDAPDEL